MHSTIRPKYSGKGISQAFFLRPMISNTIIKIVNGKNRAQGDVVACDMSILVFIFERCEYPNDVLDTFDIGMATSCGDKEFAYIVKRSSVPRKPVSMLSQFCALNQIS